MSETPPDPADVHTGTDHVELPAHEKELRKLWREVAERGTVGLNVDYPRIVTTLFGDIDALTAERDELQAILDGRPKNMSEFIHLLDQSVVLPPATIDAARAEAERHRLAREDYWEQLTAARAELAAANAKISKWAEDYKKLAHDCGGTELERQSLAARCAELEREVAAFRKSNDDWRETTGEAIAEQEAAQRESRSWESNYNTLKAENARLRSRITEGLVCQTCRTDFAANAALQARVDELEAEHGQR